MISIFITLFSLITHDLPIINNTYKCKLYFPFIGNQNIQYIRYEEFTSALLLSGIINTEGKLFFDKNDVYNYSLDENINQILLKYKCKINEAYYNKIDDEIILKLKIKPLNIKKHIILKNEKTIKRVEL
tara:strand:- start:7754 stop:8140 length:387 start_codon:yes stop_codon:yes gene_type:complete